MHKNYFHNTRNSPIYTDIRIEIMSDTFQNLADRAACEKQIIRKSQFSKVIFSGKNTAFNKVNGKTTKNEMIIVC